MARTMPMGSSGRHPVVTADRLSSLPDGLLHTIMSFLKARQAVQTCVLSRRWEKLWCSMPCLDIVQREFAVAPPHGRVKERFEEFVNSLLMFHNAPSLDCFRFHVTEKYEIKIVERWLRRGIKCCPVRVEISSSATNAPFYKLPHLGPSACRLKRLHLVEISLDESFTQHLLSGCPLLQVLKLTKCHLDSPQITSYTLKYLTISYCTTLSGKLLNITAPALISFQLVITDVRSSWGGILVNEMPSLLKAWICFESHGGAGSSSQERPCKLLCNLINVRNLKLYGLQTLSILRKGSDTFPIFSKLRTLIFDGCFMSDDFPTLGCFLSNAPSLEKLTLQYCKLFGGSRKRKRMAKRISFKCLNTLTFKCPKLKLIEIKYKENDVHQLFGLLSGVWRNLPKTTIQLIKA